MLVLIVTHVHTSMYNDLCVYIYIFVQNVYLCVYMHACIYIYTYIYIYMCVEMCMRVQ